MSKNISIVIAIILVIVGIIGVIFCTIPTTSKEEKVVIKYINAIDNCDIDGVKDCLYLGDLAYMDVDDYGLAEFDDNLSAKLDYMKMSDLAALYEIPEDVTEIKEVSVVSIYKDSEDKQDVLSEKTSAVNATIKVTYIDADGESISFTAVERFQILETSKGNKIVSA